MLKDSKVLGPSYVAPQITSPIPSSSHDFLREGSSNIRIAMMDSDENDAHTTQWTKSDQALARFKLCYLMLTIPICTRWSMICGPDHARILGERGIFAILSRVCHWFSKFDLGQYFQVLTNSCDCKAKPLLPRILHPKCQVSCSVNKSHKSCCNKTFKPLCYRRQSFSCHLQIIWLNSCWICPQCELWIVIVSVAFTSFF